MTTILVVDDKEENRLLIRHFFDGPEYQVVEAANGREGVAIAQSQRPDCILLDLDMPVLGGFPALEELQRDPRTRQIPVIILTASDDSLQALDRALRTGAVDYITKPISPMRVAIRVRGAIERARLLRDLDDLRATFTSMLVHDLRAPLAVILGYVDLLATTAAGPLTAKQEGYLAKMRESGNRMLRLIADILDVSKLEAGKLTLERQPVNLATLIVEVAERFRPVAEQKRIVFEVRDGNAAKPILADPHRLDQVLMNLLGNALKFTPAGGRITAEVSDLGSELEVAVSDSGRGIAAGELPLLFQKFSQTSSARSAREVGTGLGLVICRHLVEAHVGRIWTESLPDQGARFVFRLPREEAGTQDRKAEGTA